jgi:hypothetical protein
LVLEVPGPFRAQRRSCDRPVAAKGFGSRAIRSPQGYGGGRPTEVLCDEERVSELGYLVRGNGDVYLADDLKHERKVALKVLKPELAGVVGADRCLAEIKTTVKPPTSAYPAVSSGKTMLSDVAVSVGSGCPPLRRD